MTRGEDGGTIPLYVLFPKCTSRGVVSVGLRPPEPLAKDTLSVISLVMPSDVFTVRISPSALRHRASRTSATLVNAATSSLARPHNARCTHSRTPGTSQPDATLKTLP